MMLIRKSKSKNNMIAFYILIYVMVSMLCIILSNLKFDFAYIGIIGAIGGLLFLIYIYLHFRIVRRLLNFGIIFTSILFLFCFGQFFLYGFGIKYDYFFLNDYYRGLFGNNNFYLLYGEIVSILALGLFQLAMLISAKTAIKVPATTNRLNVALKTVSCIIFIVAFPIILSYKLYLVFYSFINGYAAIGSLPQPLIVRFIGVFIIPSAIGMLVCNIDHKKKFKLICLLLLIYAFAGLMTGGRTEPLIVLASIAAIVCRKKLKLKTAILFSVVIYFVATLIVTAAQIRSMQSFSVLDGLEYFATNFFTLRTIILLIGEMGFSGSSMIWTVYLIETGQQNLYFGMTYVGAVANVFPSSLDVLGLLSGLDQYAHLESWLTETFGMNFGVGFSLIAEAYLNFGFGAIIVMFFYGLLLNQIFNCGLKGGTWNYYKSLVMFSVLLTLPRRASLYFADQWMLCVIAIWLLCQISKVIQRDYQGKVTHGKIACQKYNFK